MISRLLYGVLFLSFVSACGKKDSPAPPPPPITAYENWTADSELAGETIMELQTQYEKVPEFFEYGPVMVREDRDNFQSGYIYPLFFATRDHKHPGRHWEDGYTARKSNRSKSTDAEIDKLQGIEEDMRDYWGDEFYEKLYQGLDDYKLIDVRYYSVKPQAPQIGQSCFSVRWVAASDATYNFCFPGHRYLKDEKGQFPKVIWNQNRLMESRDSVDAFKLFVLSIACYEVLFDNPDNRVLRDFFMTYEPLSLQLQKASDHFDGAFQHFIDGEAYKNGRQ